MNITKKALINGDIMFKITYCDYSRDYKKVQNIKSLLDSMGEKYLISSGNTKDKSIEIVELSTGIKFVDLNLLTEYIHKTKSKVLIKG
jgi:hypothetical protein